MPNDKIRIIKKTEKEAELTINNATIQAKEILAQSQKQAYKIIEQREDEGETKAKRMIESYKEEAQVDIVDIQHKIAGECNEIRRKAKPYIDDAMKFIAGRITKKDVSC